MSHENDRPPEYRGSGMGITDAINEVYDWYFTNTGLISGEEINSGCCREFADSVIERVEGAELECGGGHCWVNYEGMAYDAEADHGVDDAADLPFYQRLNPA